jgi:hypothetical protein
MSVEIASAKSIENFILEPESFRLMDYSKS